VTGSGDDDGETHPILTGVPERFRVRSWTYHVRPDHPPASARVLVRGRPIREIEAGPDRSVNPAPGPTPTRAAAASS